MVGCGFERPAASATARSRTRSADVDRLPRDLDLAALIGPTMPVASRAAQFSTNFATRTHGLLYPLSGFVVGAIVGLTGMGGGSLMTPLLILLFGVHPLTAVGTDLLYAAVTKTAGTAIHSKNGNVDWRVAGLLAVGSVPATVTIWVLSRMPKQSPTTAATFSVSIGVALIIAAVAGHLHLPRFRGG
jgi:Sulfite exporter TauE/SafE